MTAQTIALVAAAGLVATGLGATPATRSQAALTTAAPVAAGYTISYVYLPGGGVQLVITITNTSSG